MRISKAIRPIIVALGGQASEIGGKSLSKIASYVAPYAESFINDPVKANSIATTKIKDSAVSTNKIKAKAVTEDKLSDELAAKINSGGGNEDFLVTYTIDSDKETVVADKTIVQIKEARDAGKNIIAYVKNVEDGDDYIGPDRLIPRKNAWNPNPESQSSNIATLDWVRTIVGEDSVYFMQIEHSADGYGDYVTYRFAAVPYTNS